MDGECFEWETCLHSSRSTWVSALHQWSKRHSEDGRDEMRTGGGLSFNEEWSSPVDLRKRSQRSSMDYPFLLLLAGLIGIHTHAASKTKEFYT